MNIYPFKRIEKNVLPEIKTQVQDQVKPQIKDIKDNEKQKLNGQKPFAWLLILFLLVGGIGLVVYITNSADEPETVSVPENTDDIDWVNDVPCTPEDLSGEWKEITDSRMLENSNRRRFQNKRTSATINFDKGDPTTSGEKAQDHWHRDNPNKVNKRNQYLDENGNEVGKNTPESHIKPKCK